MEFRILGPLEIADAGRPVDLGPPKQRALLAALLVRVNQVVSLDRLIDDLWGAEPPPAATGSLQAYVANLRRILEPDRPPRTPARVLASRAPGYVLRLASDQLDAARFADTLATARTRLAAGDARSAYAGLTAGLALWRGPALADVAHWDFAAAEVARLEELRLLAWEAYAEAGLVLGRPAEAISALEALVEAAPLRERIRELLALSLYRSQRQADALQVISTTRRLFRTELGIEPGRALGDLQRAILAHDPALDWHPPRSVDQASVPVPEPASADPAADADALVGRQQPLHIGLAAVDTAAAGRGGLLWIAGEPGIGKTRLAQEVAAAAAARGFAVGWGRSPDNEGVPAFWPWRQVLSELSGAYPDRFAEACRRVGPDLAPLLPDHRPTSTTPPSPAGSAQSAFLACDAASRLLADLTAERPALVVLDDLHWADPPTLQLAGYLATRLAGTPILVVATFRDTETGGDDRLAATLAATLREPRTQRLALTGLDPDGVAQLVAQRAGRAVDARLTAAIHARTEGNPFFVGEMTRLLVSEHQLDQAPTDGAEPPQLGVPDSVRDVVRRRIARLPEQAVTLLAMGAVVGPEFDLDVVALVSGLDDEAVANAMEAPVLTGLITESAERPGRYGFTHALIRETLYAGLTGPRRNRLHARTAEALAARRRPGLQEALAHHAWRAGPALPAEPALDLISAATDQAVRSFGYEQATEHVRRALVVLERLPDGPDRDERELRLQSQLGHLLAATRGQSAPGVAEAFDRARELARVLGRPVEYGEAVWGLWSAHCLAARYEEADRLSRELLRLAEHDRAGPAARLAGLQARSAVTFQLGDLQTSARLLAEGVAIGGRLLQRPADGAPPLDEHTARLALSLTVSCHAGQALVAARQGDAAAAVRSRVTALRHARQSGSPVVMAYALYVAAEVAVLQRDPTTAGDLAAEVISISRRYGFPLWAATGEIFAAWAGTLARQEDGAARIEAALVVLDQAGCRLSRTLLLALLAEVHAERGRRPEAIEALAAAEAEVEMTGERFFVSGLHLLRERLA